MPVPYHCPIFYPSLLLSHLISPPVLLFPLMSLHLFQEMFHRPIFSPCTSVWSLLCTLPFLISMGLPVGVFVANGIECESWSWSDFKDCISKDFWCHFLVFQRVHMCVCGKNDYQCESVRLYIREISRNIIRVNNEWEAEKKKNAR